MSNRTGIMLCYPLEEKRLLKWGAPYIVQPKLNGDRCRCVIDSNYNINLISSEGFPRNQSVPHIVDTIRDMLKIGSLQAPIELDGELYIHDSCHEEIRSIVSRTKNLHPEFEKAQYHIFDFVEEYPALVRSTGIRSLRESIKDAYKAIRFVETYIVNDISDVYNYLEEFVKRNYEGIIVRRPSGMYERKRSTNILKFKPRAEDSYSIVDTIEEVSIEGMPKNTLGALVLSSDDGNELFKVGSGSFLTQERRKELWLVRDKLIGKTATIKYQTLSHDRKVPVFPVLINIT